MPAASINVRKDGAWKAGTSVAGFVRSGGVWVPMGGAATELAPHQLTLGYTGVDYAFTVPAGCLNVLVSVKGAGGGKDTYQHYGGLGGTAKGRLLTTPAQVLTVRVGGAGGDANPSAPGGFNLGGAGGGSGNVDVHFKSAAGGGRSEVIVAGVAVLIGGGGGGAGSYYRGQSGFPGGSTGGGQPTGQGQAGAYSPSDGGGPGGGGGKNGGNAGPASSGGLGGTNYADATVKEPVLVDGVGAGSGPGSPGLVVLNFVAAPGFFGTVSTPIFQQTVGTVAVLTPNEMLIEAARLQDEAAQMIEATR